MNPQGPAPVDYLNQIAPQAPQKKLFSLNKYTLILIGLVVIVAVILISTISRATIAAQKEPWQRITVRLSATSALVDKATASIKSSQLRSLNSDLKLYLTNTQRDFSTPLAQLKITTESIPKKITKEETATGIEDRLEDGRLNARYDSTYAREMAYQTGTILAELQALYRTNVGPKTKEIVKTAYDNLLPTYESLSEFSTTNE